jgi:hypothetical protein
LATVTGEKTPEAASMKKIAMKTGIAFLNCRCFMIGPFFLFAELCFIAPSEGLRLGC